MGELLLRGSVALGHEFFGGARSIATQFASAPSVIFDTKIDGVDKNCYDWSVRIFNGCRR